MINRASPFLGYDIRGRVGDALDEAFAFRLGRAYAERLAPRRVAVGGDARLSTPALKAALSEGLASAGVAVADLGLVGTEQVYHAAFALGFDGGVMVTASHNPPDDNGFKLVGPKARPLDAVAMSALEAAVWPGRSGRAGRAALAGAVRGRIWSLDATDAYLDALFRVVDPQRLPALRVVLDAGHGAAGPLLQRLGEALRAHGSPLDAVPVRARPDGHFPEGVPNPHDPARRARTRALQAEHAAPVAVAFDGDFDRCFLFAEAGAFVSGYAMVGELARVVLARARADEPRLALYEPRLFWNTVAEIAAAGGEARMTRTGHSPIKAAMRDSGALYAGEISGHHYFRAFGGCDSGMLPWLLLLEAYAERRAYDPQVRFVAPFEQAAARFPASEERNFRLTDGETDVAGMLDAAARTLPAALRGAGLAEQCTREPEDGVGLDCGAWRMRLRASQTEPLLRLTLETRGDADLLTAAEAAVTAWLLDAGVQPV